MLPIRTLEGEYGRNFAGGGRNAEDSTYIVRSTIECGSVQKTIATLRQRTVLVVPDEEAARQTETVKGCKHAGWADSVNGTNISGLAPIGARSEEITIAAFNRRRARTAAVVCTGKVVACGPFSAGRHLEDGSVRVKAT